MRILVVGAPSYEELRRAREAFEARGIRFFLPDNCAAGVEHGVEKLRTQDFEGVLTNTLTLSTEGVGKKGERIAGGVSIALHAQNLNIPFILYSENYLFTKENHWIYRLGKFLGWPEIIQPIKTNEINWEKALDSLATQI